VDNGVAELAAPAGDKARATAAVPPSVLPVEKRTIKAELRKGKGAPRQRKEMVNPGPESTPHAPLTL
jgi:hypothetical protein